MSICNCSNVSRIQGTNKFFSFFARSYARRYRKKGLEKVQKYLLEGIMKVPVKGKKILDIGCGIGALHLDLLNKGAAGAVGIDISEGMIEKARSLAREMNLQEKVNLKNDDFNNIHESIAAADITILDKVVCCYDNPIELINYSADKTKSIYALSYPRDRLFIKYVIYLQILVARLFRLRFHPCWHNWTEIGDNILKRGFRLVYTKNTFIWDVAVYSRVGSR